MRIFRHSLLLSSLVAATLVSSGYAQEKVTHLAPPPGSPNTPANILPDSFGGWKLVPPAKFSKDPGAADPTDAPLLKEYGFIDFEGATYTRDDGGKLTIRAARFEDASGAYGAFMFYNAPVMINEKIGDQEDSLNSREIF